MKILVVSHYFRPESFRINDLAAELVARGHAVTVLTGLPSYPRGRLFPGYSWRGPYRERLDGVDVRRVPMLPRGRGGALRLGLNYLSAALAASLAAPLLARERFDVVFAFAPSPTTTCLPALCLKGITGVPVVLWVQDIWPQSLAAAGMVRSPAVLRAVGWMVRSIYRRCDLVLGQSEAFVAAIRELCPEGPRVEPLPNWAEPFYRPVDLESDAAERREMPAGFTLLFAGNLGSAQSLETVIAAAESLREQPIEWVLLGDGSRKAWLEEEVRRRRLARVHLLGWRPAERMPRYLALADGLLVTLRREPILALTVPTKVQSALASGRPILATVDGEPARVLREADAGWVGDADDPHALAMGAMALLAAGPAERAAMGARGRAYAQRHFARDVLIGRLEAWMQELADRAA